MLSRLPPKRSLKYYVALQYHVLRYYDPRSFNLFRLCKVEKLRQTTLISFPVFFESLSPFFVLITIL